MYKRYFWLALLLNLLLPGLGYMYIGKLKKTLLLYVVFIFNIIIGFNLFTYESIKPLNIIIPIFINISIYMYILIDASIKTRRIKEYNLKNYNRWYYYILILIFYFSTLFLLELNPYRFQAYKMPSQSMENTILAEEFIMADEWFYQFNEIQRGELVVFFSPRDGLTKYVKRCVGLPGDTIEIIDKILHVNNKRMEFPFIFIDTTSDGSLVIEPRKPGRKDSRDNFGPFVVPDRSYFMMGDNVDNSYDSRYWGVVPRVFILGKVIVIHWSDNSNRIGTVLK